LPGARLSPAECEQLYKKREIYQRSLRHWEEMLTPINMMMEATTRSVQFWLHSWFGK
ncbi:MAG: hypothetical protein HQM00_10245, partial [Magnetococcales bacterium]|nr:hypothetical protein [Magnetococcales bacterium]